jgi:hypothetical protein
MVGGVLCMVLGVMGGLEKVSDVVIPGRYGACHLDQSLLNQGLSMS